MFRLISEITVRRNHLSGIKNVSHTQPSECNSGTEQPFSYKLRSAWRTSRNNKTEKRNTTEQLALKIAVSGAVS